MNSQRQKTGVKCIKAFWYTKKVLFLGDEFSKACEIDFNCEMVDFIQGITISLELTFWVIIINSMGWFCLLLEKLSWSNKCLVPTSIALKYYLT